MSSLIDVLKQLQEELDLDSRTEARARFDQMSKTFESAMAEAFPKGGTAVKELAAERMMLAEYWMNQWVGNDPEWHGDWGKVLRKAVREIHSERAEGDKKTAVEMLAEAAEQDGPDQDLLVPGTIRIGRAVLQASRSELTGSVVYTTKNGSERVATERLAKQFKPSESR